VPATAAGRFPVEALGVELGRWEGNYLGNQAVWIRAWEPGGAMLPLPEERADAQQARADALAARLRALGVDPDAP